MRFSSLAPATSCLALAFLFSGCAADGDGSSTTGGSTGTGGAGPSTGGTSSASGGASGGTPGVGGSSMGGSAAGGTSSGGATSGGAASGGSSGSAGAAGGSGGGSLGGAGGGGGVTGATGGTSTGGTVGGGDTPVPLDASLLSKCTGTSPIKCSINVANGNHTVTVELGDTGAASTSRVQSELYRISVPQTQLAAGTLLQQTFTVNVRAEEHDGYSAPGGILNLLIDGSAPRLHGLGVAAAPNAITIHVAGDSTVCDWDPAATNVSSANQRGWAQGLTQYFKAGVGVANYADSGETAGGFYTKFWPGAGVIKANDYVFIQFGHNDQKNTDSTSAYKSNLLKYVNDARSKNATPVIFTPVARKGASTGAPGFGGLDDQARQLASSEKVALVDLTKLSIDFFATQTDKNQFFAEGDGTHLSEVGATQISKLVTQAIKAGTLPLKDHVR